jgi:cell division septum initiation protein DivIVA
MKAQTVSAAAVAGAVLFLGCGGGRPLLLNQRASEVPALRAECKAKKVSSGATARADSLATVAQSLMAKGKHNEALDLLDEATVLYRLSLARYQLQQARHDADSLSVRLGSSREMLATYQEILQELKTTR